MNVTRYGCKGLAKEEIDRWVGELRQLKRTRKRRSRARKDKKDSGER